MINESDLQNAVRQLLDAVGEDLTRQGLMETPRRVSDLYREVLSGTNQDVSHILATQFDEDHREMVILRDIAFYSICEHHLMPFFGVAHIGYIPSGRVVGISKLARALDVLSKRLQVQERLTSSLADAIWDSLNPDGVAVVLRAEHLCIAMRGIKKPGATMVTSATRGEFRNSPVTRSEFLNLVGERD